MITKITGKLVSVADEIATFSIPPMEYEVYITENSRRHLQPLVGTEVALQTIHYLDGNVTSGGRLTPRLVGFLSTPERDFFELFCSVDGVGVKKALRAMTQPVQDIAVKIEQQDSKGLSGLPGIGPATAERIIAKLRRKMPKFALLVRRDSPAGEVLKDGVVEDTFQALLALGHGESDARQLIEQALASGGKFKDTETLIQAIYKKQFGS
ncbi:Holliday junction branch migration protein RuvA [Aureliella helgolandensis]|uniref:Holliday junction branch migration complex subunit RuvA n=1 Tax=Aureliella helgolandensis TaxID=2527968 RepID=A0A518GF64_9BACT|nr:Holliday junction branch migration protein RuvA [Aureliella helgolandensis]QDV27242.1 Holliday junction ATP-dependent DNA helicase RuvA [Aureliella helgolandensis]